MNADQSATDAPWPKRLRDWLRDHEKATFAGAGILLLFCKLWLVRGEDIIGSATQHDALWYVRSATHWYWGTPYDWTAFIRPCAYPLWIAVVHSLHLALRLAIELLQIGGALVLLCAFRALGATRLVSLLSFAAVVLHPAGFQLNDYTMSDTFYAALLWWLLGGLMLSFATTSRWLLAAIGIAIAVLWHTREEGFLLVVLVGVWSCVFVVREKLDGRSMAGAVARTGRPLALLVMVAAAVIAALYAANFWRFRSFARSEMTAPIYQSLFHSLLRIKPADPKPYAPITTDTLHRAFAISPTFARLQPGFDGPLGEAFRSETLRQTGVRNEIGAGWIVWATRATSSELGFFEEPVKAHDFFQTAAQEINAACDDGRLRTRFVLDGFLDPLAQSGGLKRLPYSAFRIGARIFARGPTRPIPDDSILTPEEAALYDEMTARCSRGNLQRETLAARLEDAISRHHYLFQIGLHLAAGTAIAGLFVTKRRRVTHLHELIPVVLLAAAVLSRLALFAWLDATAFDSTQDRFLFPVLPLWSACLFLFIRYVANLRRPATEAPRVCA